MEHGNRLVSVPSGHGWRPGHPRGHAPGGRPGGWADLTEGGHDQVAGSVHTGTSPREIVPYPSPAASTSWRSAVVTCLRPAGGSWRRCRASSCSRHAAAWLTRCCPGGGELQGHHAAVTRFRPLVMSLAGGGQPVSEPGHRGGVQAQRPGLPEQNGPAPGRPGPPASGTAACYRAVKDVQAAQRSATPASTRVAACRTSAVSGASSRAAWPVIEGSPMNRIL